MKFRLRYTRPDELAALIFIERPRLRASTTADATAFNRIEMPQTWYRVHLHERTSILPSLITFSEAE